MPGESNTIGEYTAEEIAAMSSRDFHEAKQRDFKRAATPDLLFTAEERPAAAGIDLGSSVPAPSPQPPVDVQPSASVWATRKFGGTDFTCPSGQTCKLRPLSIESLMMEGVLDQVTRLEGLAQQLIDNASGLPPEKQQMPSKEDFAKLLNLINVVIPLAVAEPRVYKDDDQSALKHAIRVSDIDVEDRVAILNEALKGLKKLDNFRPAG